MNAVVASCYVCLFIQCTDYHNKVVSLDIGIKYGIKRIPKRRLNE